METTHTVAQASGKTAERMGQPWTDDEVRQLLMNIQKKRPILEISEEHKRTVGGILSRIKQLAYEYLINDKRPIEEVMKFTGLSKYEIEETVNKRNLATENAAKKKESKALKKEAIIQQPAQIQPTGTALNLLQDIYMRMETLEAERRKDLMLITNITMCLKTAIQLLREP